MICSGTEKVLLAKWQSSVGYEVDSSELEELMAPCEMAKAKTRHCHGMCVCKRVLDLLSGL